MWSKVRALFAEALIAIAITSFGWFLIGFYLAGNYLETGYQDWMFHAFRIDEIADYGIPSWNHAWSNGLNIFRGYHFIAHLPAVALVNYFNFTEHQAMTSLIVGLFITIRVFIYIFLRSFNVSRTISIFAVILSFVHPRHYVLMSDYASYIAGYSALLISLIIHPKALNNRL